MNSCRYTTAILATVALASCALVPSAALAKVEETNLSKEEWSKLDTFENHVLAKANQTFNESKWRQAHAEYDSFILEFPRSKAVPFVLLRKGRCKQQDGKLFKAVDEYAEVLDYFPNHIRYAGPALYRIGECHQNKGDIPQAMKAWAEMASDEDYSKHPLAALAVNALADNLMKQDKEPEAVKYYEQVAVDFKDMNREAADRAAGPVTAYYMRAMQEEAYRAFYAKRRPTDTSKSKTPPPLENDAAYWKNVMHNVEQHGKFEAVQKDLKTRYFSYWIGKLRSKFRDDDGYQLKLIQWQHAVDGDLALWARSIDEQFERKYKPGDAARVISWMWICAQHPDKVESYYRKLDPQKLTVAHKTSLIDFFYRNKMDKQGRTVLNLLDHGTLTYEEKKKLVFLFYKLRLNEDAQAMLGRIHYGGLSDDDIERLGNDLGRYKYDPERMVWVWYRMRSKHRAMDLNMRYRHRARQAKEGLPVATELTQVDDYAQSAWRHKGDFHKWLKQYDDAIAAYRSADDPPWNLWGIVECMTAKKDYSQAIAQLEEIERFFEKDRARAAFAIADVYNKAGDKGRHISSLRAVLKKYPKTGESSRAHERLEKMGVRIGGAVDAD